MIVLPSIIAQSGVSSGPDSFTKFLCSFDGTDGQTTFTDESANAHALTAVGNAQVDTAQSVFGGSSLLCDGSGDYVTTADHTDWDVGTQDCAVDFNVRFNSLAGHQSMFELDAYTRGIRILKLNSSNDIQIYFKNLTTTVAWAPAINTWYHVAVTRDGSNVRCFVDGTQIGSTWTNSSDLNGVTNGPIIGGASSGVLNGWMDEVRFSVGDSRWTANFTPPAAPY